MVENSVLVGGSVVMMLIVGGITAFVLFGEDETDNGQNNTNQVLCRDVNCGSHLVNDFSQRNTIVELKDATHVCCVEKQDENESSDEEDDEKNKEEKSAFGFTISLVLLIAMVALVGFALRALVRKPANGGERKLAATPSAASQPNNTYKTTESGGGGAISSAAPLEETTRGSNGVESSSGDGIMSKLKSGVGTALSYVPFGAATTAFADRKGNEVTETLAGKIDEAKDDAFAFAHTELNFMTEKGMGLVLKISVVIGILIIMILIGVTVFEGKSYFSS